MEAGFASFRPKQK